MSKLIITARSEVKAKAVIDKLVAATGKNESMFDYCVLDLSDRCSN